MPLPESKIPESSRIAPCQCVLDGFLDGLTGLRRLRDRIHGIQIGIISDAEDTPDDLDGHFPVGLGFLLLKNLDGGNKAVFDGDPDFDRAIFSLGDTLVDTVLVLTDGGR